jgi:hypothetical protein
MSFSRSIAVTAPPYALDSLSRIFWKIIRARRKNGRGFVPLILNWPLGAHGSSKLTLEHHKIG